MEDLKARINALESKQALDSEVASLKAVAPPSTNIKTSSGVMPLITVTKPAPKQEPQEDPAKQTMEHEIKPAPEGTFQMYGFAMLDAGYNFGQINPDWFDVMRPTKLPAFQERIWAEWKCLLQRSADAVGSQDNCSNGHWRSENDL